MHCGGPAAAARTASCTSVPQAQLPPPLLHALYEALAFPSALDDAGVAAAASAAARALRARGYDLGESGRFPGLYKLLASGDAATRAEVRARGGHRPVSVGRTWAEARRTLLDRQGWVVCGQMWGDTATRAEMVERGPWTNCQLQSLEWLALPTLPHLSVYLALTLSPLAPFPPLPSLCTDALGGPGAWNLRQLGGRRGLQPGRRHCRLARGTAGWHRRWK